MFTVNEKSIPTGLVLEGQLFVTRLGGATAGRPPLLAWYRPRVIGQLPSDRQGAAGRKTLLPTPQAVWTPIAVLGWPLSRTAVGLVERRRSRHRWSIHRSGSGSALELKE